MTLPGSEAIEGVVFSPELVGPERETGLAVTRAIVRTINTHLADGYGDDALAVLAEELDVPEDQIASGPRPLFDWEVRSGTTARIQEALIEVGGVRYVQPRAEGELVDRTLYDEVVSSG
jgi:NitT/TauT family transport system substrate-binding protein